MSFLCPRKRKLSTSNLNATFLRDPYSMRSMLKIISKEFYWLIHNFCDDKFMIFMLLSLNSIKHYHSGVLLALFLLLRYFCRKSPYGASRHTGTLYTIKGGPEPPVVLSRTYHIGGRHQGQSRLLSSLFPVITLKRLSCTLWSIIKEKLKFDLSFYKLGSEFVKTLYQVLEDKSGLLQTRYSNSGEKIRLNEKV